MLLLVKQVHLVYPINQSHRERYVRSGSQNVNFMMTNLIDFMVSDRLTAAER